MIETKMMQIRKKTWSRLAVHKEFPGRTTFDDVINWALNEVEGKTNLKHAICEKCYFKNKCQISCPALEKLLTQNNLPKKDADYIKYREEVKQYE